MHSSTDGRNGFLKAEEKAMAILILAINQLTDRKALTKISEWFRQSPLHRWISLEQEKLIKEDLFNI